MRRVTSVFGRMMRRVTSVLWEIYAQNGDYSCTFMLKTSLFLSLSRIRRSPPVCFSEPWKAGLYLRGVIPSLIPPGGLFPLLCFASLPTGFKPVSQPFLPFYTFWQKGGGPLCATSLIPGMSGKSGLCASDRYHRVYMGFTLSLSDRSSVLP